MKAKTAHCATLLCRCSNAECEHECDIGELENLENGEFELQGGDIVPDGVCPKCGSASYELNDQWDRLRASRDLLFQTVEMILDRLGRSPMGDDELAGLCRDVLAQAKREAV